MAINEIPEFKYRIHNEKVVIYDEIHASSRIDRDDGTFGFSFVPYYKDLQIFRNLLSDEIKKVKPTTGLSLNETYKKTI